MTFLTSRGYLSRKTGSGKGTNAKATTRNWWIVKNGTSSGYVPLGTVCIPKKLIGKKVMFKIEVIEDE